MDRWIDPSGHNFLKEHTVIQDENVQMKQAMTIPIKVPAKTYKCSWQAKYKLIIPMKIIIGMPMRRSSRRAKINQNKIGHDFRKMVPMSRNR